MTKQTQDHLKNILNRLEASTQKILETRGYTKDSAQIRLLQELIKEQISEEDSRHSTRQIR